jgi:hypothetical protein
MPYGVVQTDTVKDSLNNTFAPASAVMRNRLINGSMVISQRYGTGAATFTNGTNNYITDRWNIYITQTGKLSSNQSSTAPTGYINSLLVTSSSAYSVLSTDIFVLRQIIEGYNIADLAWGTANAKTVTLSFWVYSSLTGTFGGSISNGTAARSYPFNYTISSASTWTQISVTIPGDTSGTWATDNTAGMYVNFGLGVGTTGSGTAGSWAGSAYYSATGAVSVVGTSGATFYITGVQLEVGLNATNFEYRQYGTELALCQRYYETNMVVLTSTSAGNPASATYFKVTKRTAPTLTQSTVLENSNASGFTQNNIRDESYKSYCVCSAAGYITQLVNASAEL